MVPPSTVVASLLVLIQPAVAASVSATEGPGSVVATANGVPIPVRLEVASGKAVAPEVTDTGTSAADFECRAPRKVETIAPKTEALHATRQLAAGDFDSFDENRPEAAFDAFVAE